jgi:N-acetylmuramoyl-L-alanine amidase
MLPALCLLLATGPVVCLDPGHPSEVGKGTQGKQITEVALAWKIAVKLKSRLQASGVRVVMTKQSENQYVTNINRAEIANCAGANLMLRLHCDASTKTGYTVFAPFSAGTFKGRSGPSAAVIQGSRAAASIIHQSLQSRFKGVLHDNGLQPDTKTAVGAKHGALVGSIYSKVPVVLVEMFTLNNPTGGPNDEKFAASAAGQAAMVDALADGVTRALQAQKSRPQR